MRGGPAGQPCPDPAIRLATRPIRDNAQMAKLRSEGSAAQPAPGLGRSDAGPGVGDGPLQLETVTPLPAEVAVGAGTALFADGVCLAPAPIRRLDVAIGDRVHPAMGWGMAEPGGRRGSGYWWGVFPIAAVGGPQRLPIELRARLANGSEHRARAGELQLVPHRSEPELERLDPPLPGEGEGPLVAICMATFDPDPRLFRRQIESIRAQTHGRWVCLISDDSSSPEGLAAIEAVVGGDRRFVVSSSVANAGHYRNFERALMMAPAAARYIAFSDQDDVWHPDKLASLIAGLRPGSSLVYSDMRLVGERGEVLADTYWTMRRNNYTDFASMVLANTVTGAASLFDAGLLRRALPFPPRHSALFHDHWIAQIAMAVGPISYVDRPLHDYVQHGAAALGHSAANGRGRYSGRVYERLVAAGRNLRARGYRPAWRAPYFNIYCRLVLSSEALRARCADVLDAEQLAVLDRISDSPRGIAWMLGRSTRDLWGADETLGRERAILAGFAWRRAALLRRWERERRTA
jgi:glycosyltransferase involved in cell wall biosynthesis